MAAFASILLWYLVVRPLLAFILNPRQDAPTISPATIFAAAFVIGLIHYGSTKGFVGSVTFPYTDPERRYITDTGSYVTNDYVHVSISTFLVPSSAPFLGYVRPCGSTNDAEWVEFFASTFGDFHSPSNIPYAGAISNDFQFFTTWTPGPVVHTNGVATVNWYLPDDWFTRDFQTGKAAIINTSLITNNHPVIIKGSRQ